MKKQTYKQQFEAVVEVDSGMVNFNCTNLIVAIVLQITLRYYFNRVTLQTHINQFNDFPWD